MRSLLAAAVVCLAAAPGLAADDGLMLRSGDRVVFYGDSITQQRLYTRYVQQYIYVRYPELDIEFFNAGWGGDTAKGANARLERDVLELDPTVVTLCFGMNDGRYRSTDPAILKGFEAEMEGLVARLALANVRVLVLSPGCVDSDRRPNLAKSKYNDALAELGRAAERVAKKHGCRYVDLRTPMLRVQTELKRANAEFTMIPDSVHPAPPGHLVMAHEILKGMGAERMPAIGEFDASDGALRFTSSPTVALPFWIDGAGLAVARACGLLDDLAAQELRIKGVAKGTYEVQIDGSSLGTHTARELAKGIAVVGSWSAAARDVHDRVSAMENEYFDLWRKERLPGLESTRAPEIDAIANARIVARMGLLALDHDMVRAIAAPSLAHRITLEELPTGPNLALGKSYESSDTNTSNWGEGGLTDGSWAADAQDCFATGSAARFPKHVTVDLGKTKKIGVVRLGVPEFGATKTVRVAVSRTGKTFSDVGTRTFAQKRAERVTLRFDPIPARYVRLIYEDHHAARVGFPPTFAFTTELEVYGP